jgi:hypothetical protein
MKGLGDIVVSTRDQRRNLLLLTVTDGKDNDGCGAPLPQSPDNLDSIEIGKPQIENNHIGFTACRFPKAIECRLRIEDPIAIPFEGYPKQSSNLRLVINQQSGWG